jgi:hypothetical protein
MPVFQRLLPALASLALCAQAPETPPSFIAAPIRIDLAPWFQTAEQTTPKVPPGVDTWLNLAGPAIGGATYRFNLYRDPLSFALSDNRLAVHTTVNYWLQVGVRMQGWIKGLGSCGIAPEPFRRARLGILAEVALTPDWRIDLHCAPEEPMRMDACRVTALGYDITDKVLAAMKDSMLKSTLAMEQQLRDSSLLRQKVENAWLQAQQPVELSPGVFLLMHPEKVRLPPLRSNGKELLITPEIQVRPSLSLGTPAPQPYLPLPPLDLSASTVQPGFRLRVETDLSFAQATSQLDKQMIGQHFHTDKGEFEVTSVALHGAAGQASPGGAVQTSSIVAGQGSPGGAGLVVLEVGLKGRVNGKLTLTGQPVYDPELGTLRLDNLDYTLESRSWITRLGEWIYRSSLRRTLAEKCNFFLDQNLQTLKRQVGLGLNRTLAPGLTLSGNLEELSLDQVQVLEDRFSLVALVNGQVQIGWSRVPAP